MKVDKIDLALKQAWMELVEVEKGKQIRFSELLRNIPSKTYKSVEKVLREIRL